ncbi:MAG: gliding motility-associated C-terminal domain-containing protein [Bacteroidota bacterium]|nr:gliding motility-associated C-terminal domain-containing protein [Bacteroidota bacterium]
MKKLIVFILMLIQTSSFSQEWKQIGQDIDGESLIDKSGFAVSLSSDGTIVAIGARENDGATFDITDDRGHVRVYKNIDGTWIQMGGDIDGEARDDFSGSSVSLSSDGTRLAIGTPANDGNGISSGHVRVYEYTSGTWIQMGSDIDGDAEGDYSGQSVSLSDDGLILAIGANYNDGNGIDAGQVRIYQYEGSDWVQMGVDIDGEAAGDGSGHSISLSADGFRIAIGAFSNDGNGSGSGHVRVYQYGGDVWMQVGADIDGEAEDDYSGSSVSLSSDGSIVAIGANFNDGNGINSGHVRVYKYMSDIWVQMGEDIDGEATTDQSGYAVSLSSDGSIVAIGAYLNDGNGSGSGHVRVYKYFNGTWIQLGSDIDGETEGDGSGAATSLSSDGYKVAIGAYANDGNGENAGHVRVFYISGIDSCAFNILPVPINDYYNLMIGDSIVVDATDGLLSNDINADNSLYVELLEGPKQGLISLNSDGSFTYKHDGSDNLYDSITYSVKGNCIDCDSICIEGKAYFNIICIESIDLGLDIERCIGETVTLDVGLGYDNYLWSTGDTTSSIIVNQTGKYSVSVSRYPVGFNEVIPSCTVSDTILVIFSIPPAPSGEVKQSVVCGSNISSLDALGSEIKWYDALSGGNILSLSTVLMDGNVYYASQTISGCESEDRLAVSVELNFSNNQIIFPYQFKPPNAFSPNGDGINDTYILSNLPDPSQNLPVDVCDDNFEYISIIDRNGAEVYKSYDRNFEWDGSGLSSGIYFYFIKYTISEYKGVITIFK